MKNRRFSLFFLFLPVSTFQDDERNYVSAMDEKVIPYLTEHRKIFFLEREAGKKLYCVSYRADTPRGVILISHGFTETAEKYLEPVYYFIKMNFHVFCVEHCGHVTGKIRILPEKT